MLAWRHATLRYPASRRPAGRNVALVDALHHQRAAHLLEKFVVEPAHQPAHLDARAGSSGKSLRSAERGAADLVEIFGDDGGAGNRRRTLFDQNRRGSRRIELEKFRTPLPHPFLDQPRRLTVLFEHKPHEAGMRTDRMMKQRQHAGEPCPPNPAESLIETWPRCGRASKAAKCGLAPKCLIRFPHGRSLGKIP